MSKENVLSLLEHTICEYCKRKSIEMDPSLRPELTVPKDPDHGDFATNVAFKLARAAGEKPDLIADELVMLMEASAAGQKDRSGIDRFHVAGPGFINIYLNRGSLGKILVDVRRKGRDYGRSDAGKGKKALVEFVSANPTGPLTIAHGRQAAVGDALVRILRMTGHQVTAEYYLNDAGRQMNLLGESLWVRYQDVLGLDASLPEDGYQGDYLIPVAEKLADEKKDSLVRETHEKAVEWCRSYAAEAMMKLIREDFERLGIHFDSYYSESTLYKKNAVEKTLEFLSKKKHLYEKDGALWFSSTAFGDDKDRVVRKSTGDFTYLAPDIAYHRTKFDRGHNMLVNLWGPDHHGYVARLKAACQALGHDAGEIHIRIVQLTTLYRKGEPVRMSTRAGEFVTLRELYEEVGEDAARFFFIMRRVESHLDFDLDLAKEKSQENPVFYLQYAHARIASLLQFAERPVSDDADLELLSSEEERAVIKTISEFPKILIQASEWLEPYRLADYLRDLAGTFHRFYSHHRIVTENEPLTAARLLLCDAARVVMANGLELLGISQPDSM